MLRQALLRGCWRSSKLEYFARENFCGERREFWENYITNWVTNILALFGDKKPRRSWKSQGPRKIWRWLFFLGRAYMSGNRGEKGPKKCTLCRELCKKAMPWRFFYPWNGFPNRWKGGWFALVCVFFLTKKRRWKFTSIHIFLTMHFVVLIIFS